MHMHVHVHACTCTYVVSPPCTILLLGVRPPRYVREVQAAEREMYWVERTYPAPSGGVLVTLLV